MAVPANAPIVARRNAPLGFEWAAFTNADGLPVDFTGATVAMQVRLYGAQAGLPLIDLRPALGPLEEGVTAADGVISVLIEEASLAVLPRRGAGQNDIFRYDLLVQLPGQVAEVWAEGSFTVKPGVTDRLSLLTNEAGAFLTNDAGAYLIAG